MHIIIGVFIWNFVKCELFLDLLSSKNLIEMSVISDINPPSLEKNPTSTGDVKPTQKDSSINSKLNILDEIIFLELKLKELLLSI